MSKKFHITLPGKLRVGRKQFDVTDTLIEADRWEYLEPTWKGGKPIKGLRDNDIIYFVVNRKRAPTLDDKVMSCNLSYGKVSGGFSGLLYAWTKESDEKYMLEFRVFQWAKPEMLSKVKAPLPERRSVTD